MKTKPKRVTAESTPALPAAPVIPAIPPTSAISWFTEATLILALITFVGYWSALVFEAEYCAYFGIPYYFISLNPTFILAKSLIWINIAPALCVLIIIGVVIVKLVNTNKNKYFVIMCAVVGLCIILSLGNIFFIQGGLSQAQEQERFLVMKPQTVTSTEVPEVAVLRNYGEYLFTVPIIRKTDEHNKTKVQFEKKLFILKISDVKMPLSYEKIGPLQEKPNEPSPVN